MIKLEVYEDATKRVFDLAQSGIMTSAVDGLIYPGEVVEIPTPVRIAYDARDLNPQAQDGSGVSFAVKSRKDAALRGLIAIDASLYGKLEKLLKPAVYDVHIILANIAPKPVDVSVGMPIAELVKNVVIIDKWHVLKAESGWKPVPRIPVRSS